MKAEFEHIDWELLSKNLTGEASDLEKVELERWLAMDDRNKLLYARLADIGHEDDILKAINHLDVEHALAKVKKVKKVARIVPFRKLMRVAAVFIFALGISAIYWFISASPEVITVATKSGERMEITLTDGSVVSINENSRFTYPENFDGQKRDVKLTGEGFFSVAPDKEKPFVVDLDGAYVKVLGTQFNIVNQADAEDIAVQVSEGSVQFGGEESSVDALILKKGNAGRYNRGSQALSFDDRYDVNSMAWKTKHLVFENEHLEDVVSTLEEVYFIKMTVEEDLKTRKISATYDNQPVDVIIDILESTLHVTISKTSENGYEIVSAPN